MEMVDINIAPNGQVVTRNDKMALIDADTLVYTACLAAETEILSKDFYTEEEYEAMIVDTDETTGISYTSSQEQCNTYAWQKLDKIMMLTGCSSYELHFTIGRNSWRYRDYPEYKANRKGRKPLLLEETKNWMAKKHNGYLHTEFEADDAIVYKYLKDREKYIVCAVDKDVLNAISGKHFNYYESAKHNIDMHFIETDEETARLFPYRQALFGDVADNIIGIKGIGPVKAAKLIPDGCSDPLTAVIEAYISKGRTKEEALLNIKLCTMGENIVESNSKLIYKEL